MIRIASPQIEIQPTRGCVYRYRHPKRQFIHWISGHWEHTFMNNNGDTGGELDELRSVWCWQFSQTHAITTGRCCWTFYFLRLFSGGNIIILCGILAQSILKRVDLLVMILIIKTGCFSHSVAIQMQKKQCGFRPGWGTLDRLYTIVRVLEGA